MFPYLVGGIVLIGLPTIYFAIRFREFRKLLSGAFYVSSAVQFYLYFANVPIPLIFTDAVQSPRLSLTRAVLHLLLCLTCVYFGWFSRGRAASGSAQT